MTLVDKSTPVLFLLGIAALVPTPAAPTGSTIRLDVVRDTSLSSVEGEENGNNGAQKSLKTKSFQELAILDIDTTPLQGRVPVAARLFLNSRSRELQRRVTVSSLASEWEEGDGHRYAERRGAASFLWARQGKDRWAAGAADITAVTLGMGNTIWGFGEASEPDSRGFQSIPVDPLVVAARLAGLSYGFVVFDDVGSEYERDGERFLYSLFPNRSFWSREAGPERAPYFEVEVEGVDRQPPSNIESIQIMEDDHLPPDGISLTWSTPADNGAAGTLGFLAHYSINRESNRPRARRIPQRFIPLAGAPGTAVVMDLQGLNLPRGSSVEVSIQPVDRAGNRGEPTSIQLRVPGPQPTPILAWSQAVFDEPAPAPQVGNTEVFVIDLLDKVDPQTGLLIPPRPTEYLTANHLWSAKHQQIRLFASRNEFVAFQLLLSGDADGLEVEMEFEVPGSHTPTVRWFRFASVGMTGGDEDRFLPDPLIPLDLERITVAAEQRLAPAPPKMTSLVAEIYVPHSTPAGVLSGRLRLRKGQEQKEIQLKLRIWDFTLPDQLSFLPQMNCYSLRGRPGSDEQLAYYRLAQEHRTCLNRLGYNWRGRLRDGLAPRMVKGRFDFDSWDRNFEPLLDGSAFTDLPRGRIPVEAFYLPFNENWPREVEPSFRGGYWADEAMEPEYWRALEDASRRFYEHFAKRGWVDTFFEFYLNNKIAYKKRRGSWKGSTALWIFDEPMHTQDFWALRQYGMSFHRGLWKARHTQPDSTSPGRKPKMAFRVDLSRPQWQRDLLNGIVDIQVVSGRLRDYADRIRQQKELYGQILYSYGSANPIHQANTQPVAWALDVWALGGDGIIPWQTMGGESAWLKANQNALFYPGDPIGQKEPVPSVRLKAFRRGQQDIEYLTILAVQAKYSRNQLMTAVRQVLGIATEPSGKAMGLGPEARESLTPVDFWRLRTVIGKRLDSLHPPDRRRWVDLRTPARDPALWTQRRALELPSRRQGADDETTAGVSE